MDIGRAVKWIVILGIVYFALTVGLPWIKNQGSSSSTGSTDNNCVRSADQASNTWGGGLARFVNPPYDTMAWGSFRGSVESKMRSAEVACDCSENTCEKARAAMSELRNVVTDVDNAIRSGSSLP